MLTISRHVTSSATGGIFIHKLQTLFCIVIITSLSEVLNKSIEQKKLVFNANTMSSLWENIGYFPSHTLTFDSSISAVFTRCFHCLSLVNLGLSGSD